jgi:hypothetical protein
VLCARVCAPLFVIDRRAISVRHSGRQAADVAGRHCHVDIGRAAAGACVCLRVSRCAHVHRGTGVQTRHTQAPPESISGLVARRVVEVCVVCVVCVIVCMTTSSSRGAVVAFEGPPDAMVEYASKILVVRDDACVGDELALV